MAKFVLFFSYTPEAWSKMIEKPGDRMAAARAAVEPAGGTLDAIWFMFGEHDGMALFAAPDAEAAAAVSIAVGSTGAFRSPRTHQLVDPQRMPAVLETAGRAREAYRPPGT
jgi:uncharacterized protein with GYD domain